MPDAEREIEQDPKRRMVLAAIQLVADADADAGPEALQVAAAAYPAPPQRRNAAIMSSNSFGALSSSRVVTSRFA